MRKRVFSFVVILAVSTCIAVAQKGFHAGINYGVNATGLYDYARGGDLDGYKYKLKIGNTLGLAGGYNYNDHWGTVIELNRASLGSSYDVHNDGQPAYRENINLVYYQVPLLVKFSGGNYRSRFSSMLGPQVGFLSSADMNGADMTGSFKSHDWGLLLTSGGDITLVDDLYLNAEIRLYYGFTHANTNPYAIYSPELGSESLHNMYGGINVGLHYLFRDASERPVRAQ